MTVVQIPNESDDSQAKFKINI